MSPLSPARAAAVVLALLAVVGGAPPALAAEPSPSPSPPCAKPMRFDIAVSPDTASMGSVVRVSGVYDDLCFPDRPTQTIALLARVHGQEAFTEVQRTATDGSGNYAFDYSVTGTTDFYARNTGTGQSTRTVTLTATPWDEGCRPHTASKDRTAIRFGEAVNVVVQTAATATAFILTATSPDRQRHLGGRSGTAGDDGVIEWVVRPTENTRLTVRHGHLCAEDDLGIVTVTPHVSITAVRNGTRDYTFAGRVLPGRDQPASLWRVNADGQRVLAGRSVVAPDGTYRFTRRFSGSGRFGFQVTSGPGRTAPGVSAVRSTLVY